MIRILVVGFLTMMACLALQALASVFAARHFARRARRPLGARPWLDVFLQFSMLMIILVVGNLIQIGIWAFVYQAFDAFPDFETAMYFSGVTFTTLGYGDVVMEGRMRLLAPMQAANGLMMFGITTAAFIAAVQYAIAQKTVRPATSVHRPAVADHDGLPGQGVGREGG